MTVDDGEGERRGDTRGTTRDGCGGFGGGVEDEGCFIDGVYL